jgi:hypothetical protein
VYGVFGARITDTVICPVSAEAFAVVARAGIAAAVSGFLSLPGKSTRCWDAKRDEVAMKLSLGETSPDRMRSVALAPKPLQRFTQASHTTRRNRGR